MSQLVAEAANKTVFVGGDFNDQPSKTAINLPNVYGRHPCHSNQCPLHSSNNSSVMKNVIPTSATQKVET